MTFFIDLYNKFVHEVFGIISEENDMAIFEDENDQESPFNYVPDEILIKIFSYISLKELCCTIRVVCHRWFDISYASDLWSKLTTEDIKAITDTNFIFALIQLIRMRSSSLKYLFLDNCYDIPERELLTIADLVSSLCELSLTFCNQVNKNILKRFAQNCPDLSALCLEGCEVITDDCLLLFSGHKLHRINLSHCNNLTDSSLIFVATTFPNIKSLNIDGVQWISDEAVNLLLQNCQNSLQNLWLDGENLTDTALTRLSSCHKLRTLKISFCEQLTDITLSHITCINSLESLSLKKGKNFSNGAIISMFQSFQHGLYYLDFTDCQAFNDLVLEHLTRSSPDLITLNLSWCWDITDKGLEYIITCCQRVENLTLIGLHMLTGEPLRNVNQELPCLKYLDLTNCNSIQDNIIKDLVQEKPLLTILDYYGSTVE